jgi:hypothetical protein
VLGIIFVVAGVAAVAVALTVATVPEPPAVVPYPTVTGDLGEHLKQLQNSVQP